MDVALRKLIEEIKKIEGVKKVSVISRTGIAVNGDSYENHETFAAMSAIILGAAETALSRMGSVKKVVVFADSGDLLLLLPAGRRGVLVILAEKDVGDRIGHFLEQFKEHI